MTIINPKLFGPSPNVPTSPSWHLATFTICFRMFVNQAHRDYGNQESFLQYNFAQSSFFIIITCSPRYTERLACNIEKMGGARYMFLTHKYADVVWILFDSCSIISYYWLLFSIRDDVADHKKWSERLNCQRVLHSTEVWWRILRYSFQLSGSDYDVKFCYSFQCHWIL